MDKITLWGNTTTRTLRPIWVAEELGLSYELERMGPRTGQTSTAGFTALNPKQKIPYLTRGSFGLSESVAISRYLIANFDPGHVFLHPDTAEAEATHDEWCFYIYGELDETSLYVMRRHGDLAAIYGDAPNAMTASATYAARHLAVINRHLADRTYLLGELFALPDLLLVTCLDWALHCNIELPARLRAYRNTVVTREAYIKARTINYS